MQAKIRREEDIKDGIGINRHYKISKNIKKVNNKGACRGKINFD